MSLSIDEQKNKTCEKNTTKMELSIGYFVNMNFSNYLDYLGKPSRYNFRLSQNQFMEP